MTVIEFFTYFKNNLDEYTMISNSHFSGTRKTHLPIVAMVAWFATVLTNNGLASEAIELDQIELWIEGEFDFHDRDTLRLAGGQNSNVKYRHQASVTRSGRGYQTNDQDNNSNDQFLDASYGITALYGMSDNWELYGSLDLSFERNPDTSVDKNVGIDSLYILRKSARGNGYFAIGRQEISDERSWLIDDTIDGLSYTWKNNNIALSGILGSHSQVIEKLIGTDEPLEDFSPEHGLITYGRFYHETKNETQTSLYVAHFDNVTPGGEEDFTYIGGRILGNFAKDNSYWGELAWMEGNADSRLVKSYALDLGVSMSLEDLPMSPTFTIGYAIGNGDDGTGEDTEFRQTGLHSNNYGEVLDPDLSNIQIATFGVGISPADRWSIDLLLHHYRQVYNSTQLRSFGIDYQPGEDTNEIGSEADLTIDISNWEHTSVSLTYGRFWGENGTISDIGSLEILWSL